MTFLLLTAENELFLKNLCI